MTRLLPCIIGVRITSILKIYGMLNTKALYRHCMCVCAEQKIWNGYRYPKLFQGVQLISWHKHWSWTASDRETLVRKEHWFKTVLFLWHVWNRHWCEMNGFTSCSLLQLRVRPFTHTTFKPGWTMINYSTRIWVVSRQLRTTTPLHQKSQLDSGWIPTAMASLLRPQVVSSCCSANVQGSRSI